MRRFHSHLLLAVAASLLACTHPPATGRPSSEAVAPRVLVDGAKLGATRAQACAAIEALETPDLAAAAREAGMLEADLQGLLRAVQEEHVTVTFRDSNPACLPHLAAGVQSKGHDILQKTWDASNLKPEDQEKAGLVSDLFRKPPKGAKVDRPQLTLKDGQPVTCDYDLMDELEDDGRRVAGEGGRDIEIRRSLNAHLPVTPKGHRDRVMHGAQTSYGDYLSLHTDEPELTVLYKPEAGLTALGSDGRAWHLRSVEDALNFYRCRGTPPAPKWDVQVRQADGSFRPLE
jgi:hypothetical protein